jgi:beta propeller repeat protein
MEKPFHIGILLLLTVGLFLGVAIPPAAADAVMKIRELRITTDTASQILPDVDGYHIVYQDNRNGNWDIYLYTLMGTFEPETRITTDPANQQNPVISGNRIVYQDDRNGNWDIYLYDLETQTETQITNNTANQQIPAIHENRIVWQDDRDGHHEIYLYDLATGTESRITTSVASQDPEIYGNRIVYKKTTLSNGYLFGDVCVFDFATWRETTLSASFDYQSSGTPQPVIYGDHVAFVAKHGSSPYPSDLFNSDIVLKNVSNPYDDEWITSNTAEQVHPDLYWVSNLRYLVWQDNRNGNWDIYVYDPIRQTQTLVTNNTAGQQNPTVNGGRIVYQDDRNGNWDIYLAELSYSQIPDTPTPTPTPITPAPTPIPVTPSQTVTPKGSGSDTDTGTLYVGSFPTGATILVDGTDYGRTNRLVSNVPAGNRNLTLIKEGFQDSTMTVVVPAGGLKALAPITLRKGEGPVTPGGTGTLYVASHPTNATILIDGNPFGTTNRLVSNVPAGDRNLTLTREGYLQYTTTVTVPPGGLKVLAPVTLYPDSTNPHGGICPPWKCMECSLNLCSCVPC